MTRSLDGIFGMVLVIWTAAWLAFWRAVFWAVRFAYRRRHRIPHGHVILPALGAYAPLSLVAGPGPALLIVAAGAVWIVGTPRLERRYHEDGQAAPRPLTFAASTARIVTRKLAAVHVRFAWRQACKTAGLQPARIRKVEEVPAGWRLAVTFAAGEHAGYAEKRAASLASSLRAREVRCYTRGDDLRDGTIVVLNGSDPLRSMGGKPWPWLGRERTSLFDPIPIGLDENSRPVTISLPEQNCLLGGIPGSGKSNLASMIVAAGAGDPTARLWLIDGKSGLEFHRWHASAERVVGSDVREAIDMLEGLQAVMETRYTDLLARGARKVKRGDNLPLHLVVIDELSLFTQAPVKKDKDTFNALLRDLVARGRAAGIILIAATQRPSADVVPTNVRDLISIRAALACRTPQASDCILGSGMAAAGANAATIEGLPGVGLLLAEDSRPFRFRAYSVPDEHVDQLAQRAAQLREREGISTHNKVSDNGVPSAPAPVPAPAAVVEHSTVDDSPLDEPANPVGVPQVANRHAENRHAEPGTPLPDNVVELPRGKGTKAAVRRLRIELELRERDGRSFRQIAEAVADATGSTCHHQTVARVARELGLDESA